MEEGLMELGYYTSQRPLNKNDSSQLMGMKNEELGAVEERKEFILIYILLMAYKMISHLPHGMGLQCNTFFIRSEHGCPVAITN